MPATGFAHLFGPVPSRRLGRSLGIDVVPHKTCSFDCIYCQLGRTTLHTTARRPYVPARAIIAELECWLGAGGAADYLTLSGSGEPTLNTEAGEVIRWANAHTPIPVAVLTNGSLLWDPEVREQMGPADVLLPSLDAVLPASFNRVNRPCAGLDLGRIIAGIRAMRHEFQGEIWLEIMLVRGFNDTEADIAALRQAVDDLRPHRVQVNTVVRPPAEAAAQPLSPAELAAAARAIGDAAEIIAPLPEALAQDKRMACSEDEVRQMLRRRPCTLDDIAEGLGIHRAEAAKYVGALLRSGHIRAVQRNGRRFYHAEG